MKNGTRSDFAGDVTLDGTYALEVPVRARRIIAGCLIAASMIIAVGLRWFHLGGLSLWWDESMTAIGARLSSPNVIRFARADILPPFYFLLQHYWAVLFGNSETALQELIRLLRHSFGTGVLFAGQKFLHDPMAVALAMWTFAFSEMQLWYSREARPYALLSFLALASIYSLIRFLEKPSVKWFAIIVLAVDASLYSHTMMFFYLLGLNVTWLTYPSARDVMQRVKEVFLADVLALLLYLPWVPSLLAQVAAVHGARGPGILARPTLANFFSTMAVICGFNLEYLSAFAHRLLPLAPHTLVLCVIVALSFLSATLVIGGLWRVPRTDRTKYVSLLLYCLVPTLAVFVCSRVSTPVFIDHVFVDSSALIPIVLAYPLALRRRRLGRVFYAFAAIVLALVTAPLV